MTVVAARPSHAPVVRGRLPLAAALGVAAVAGWLTDLAFPDVGWWPLAPVGVGLVLWALLGRTVWQAVLVGFGYEFVFYLRHIEWSERWVGPLPMFALSAAGAAFFAAGAVLIAAAWRRVPRAWPTPVGRLLVLPLAIAGAWTAREALFSVWPYGGFAWGRIGQAFVDAPIAQWYAWVGVSGVTFLVVWLSAVVVVVLVDSESARLARVAVPVGLAAALLAWPWWPVAATGSLRVALVQGDGPAGYFDEREPGDLLAAQVEATLPLLDEIAAGRERVDLVLWPEGSSDWDPSASATAAAVWDWVSDSAEAPLLAQAVTERDEADGVRYYNTAILWDDDEALETYDKRHPVVWGEYIPDRWFFELVVPDLASMIAREYDFGETDAVLDVPTAAGEVRAAVNICYDIVDDALLTESVLDGGRVILSTSNNADFGRTDESAQQLQFARTRALELGRTVANVSTVGITAVIAWDASIVSSLPWYEPGLIVADLPLADTVTPAARFGRTVEIAVSALGLVLIAAATAATAARRRR